MSIRRDPLALWVLAVSLVVRALAAAAIGPGFDEAYYHLYAEHLAAGYFDHPSAVAVSAGLGHWLTGVWTPLTLRFGALLAFTLASVGFYRLAGRLYGRRAARLALLLPHATPFFLVGAGAFVIPDNVLVAAWVWALDTAQRLRDGTVERTTGFILLGALTGVALLAKYHAILLPASLVVASLYDRELRRWWRDPRLYLAFAVAVAVFSPVLAWNAANEWISFAEQFGKGTSGGFRLRFDLLGQALGGQLGYMTPWIAVALWIWAFKHPREDRADRWLLAFFLVPVVGMTLIGLTRGILPHWTMPGYIAALVLGAGWFKGTRHPQGYTIAAIGVNLTLVVLVIAQAHLGFIPLKPKADPTLDPVGWRPTIQWLEEQGELGERDILFAHKWFTGAELAWADRAGRQVVLVGDRPHMFAWWAPETAFRGRSGVIVTQERYGFDEDLLTRRFETVRRIPVPAVTRGGTLLPMVAYRVENLLRPVPPPYGPASLAGGTGGPLP